jgi:flagellar protein FlbT
MPLKVVLRPGEKLVVNGAVLAAGERTATLFLHNQAQFLRGRDMLRPEDAHCPLGHLQLAIQSLYLSAPSEHADRRAALEARARAASLARPELRAEIDACVALALAGGGYPALRRCARIIAGAPADRP